MNKRIFSISMLLIMALLLSFVPAVYAEETNEDNEQIVENVEKEDQEKVEKEEQEELKEEKPVVTNEQKADEPTVQDDTTTETAIEEHKVAVITTKVDENDNPLEGAVLQIIDSQGNVVDEWTSTKEPHTSLLPEGNYTLHEVSAPEGYKLAEDKPFTVEVKINDITAGVIHDDSHEVCWHYSGVPLFYIESNGEKEEVYCVNQGWEEPHDVSYEGVVLTEENISTFMPDADPTMTASELYHKVLDIIYHRMKAEEKFPELTETEIRMITEYALKNYTSALYNDGNWARYYAYAEDNPNGYIVDPENGTTLGKLAQHWKTRLPYGHGEKLPKIYADFYYYLISDEDHHPDDMFLYVWSTTNLSAEGESYQNLLGVTWHNPYDENNIVKLTMKNEKEKKEQKKKKKVTKSAIIVNPQTGDNVMSYVVTLIVSMGSLIRVSKGIKRKEY